MAFSYNLSELHLNPGLYTIRIKATADNYRESDFSNEVTYQVGYKLTVDYPNGTYTAPEYVATTGTFKITIVPKQDEEFPKTGDITVTGAVLDNYEIFESDRYAELTLSNQGGAISVLIGSGALDPVITKDNKALVSWDNKQLIYNPKK